MVTPNSPQNPKTLPAEKPSPLPAGTNERNAAPAGREMIRRLWFYLRQFKARLAMGLACGIVAAVSQGAVLAALQKFIKTLTVPAKDPNAAYASLLEACIGLVAIYALTGAVRYGQSIFLGEVAQRVGVAMRRDVYAHLQSLSLAFFHRRQTGSLMSTMTNDVGKLQDAAMKVKDVIATPIQIITFLVVMVSLDARLTVFALLVLPAMAASIGRLTRRLRGISNESQQRQADVVSVMEETLSAPRVVRAFSAEKREITRFENANLNALHIQMKGIRRNARIGPIVDLLGSMGIAVTLWIGGLDILSGKGSVANLIAFVMAVSYLASAVNSMGALRGSWEEMMGAADRLFAEVLDVQPDIQDAPGALTLPPVEGRIEFDHVGFSYEAGKPTLENINLTIEPGQVVALVGQTGAGKSTLADLVPRFYDPVEGAVRVDGYDLRTVTVSSLRKQIGIVPQETLLFSGTLRDNIAYGRPEATDAEVEAAARAANADSFIQSLPDKYLTPIGERGQTLSGGERQRIAIARALLADPRILILDEATSSLDASTEALVQEALDVLMRGRTTIVIAHRLSTIVGADRIVVLRQGGRIAETGTHAELLKRGEVYAALYESQQRAAELAVTAEP